MIGLREEILAKIDEIKRKIANKKAKIGVIGMGYVGLPLAMEFAGRKFVTIGFDIDPEKLKY